MPGQGGRVFCRRMTTSKGAREYTCANPSGIPLSKMPLFYFTTIYPDPSFLPESGKPRNKIKQNKGFLCILDNQVKINEIPSI